MITELTIEEFKKLNIIPETSKSLETLYISALDKTNLTTIDYMDIRDLINIAGYKPDPALAALFICMFNSLKKGSLCLRIDKPNILKNLLIFLKIEEAQNLSEQILEGIEKGKYTNLITPNTDIYTPLVRVPGKTLDTLYFRKYFVHENSLKKHIKSLIDDTSVQKSNSKKYETILNEILNESPVHLQTDKPIQLDKDQERAIHKTLTNRFVIISGGPGTGKTSILVNILRALVRDGFKNDRIMLAAPTGMAAQRVTESIQKSLKSIKLICNQDQLFADVKSSTIHRMLKYNPSRNRFYYNSSNLLPADVVIIDEVSMVDVALMDNLFKAINLNQTKVILLGDKDQLPSVDAGAVLADLIPEKLTTGNVKNSVIILKKDYRTKGQIRKLASSISNMDKKEEIIWPQPVDMTAALQTRAGNCSLIKRIDKPQWIEDVKIWADHFYRKPDKSGKSYAELIHKVCEIDTDLDGGKNQNKTMDKLFLYLKNAIILSLVRDGIYGCVGINRIIADHLRYKLDISGSTDKFSGAPVLVTRNDYSKELFNGEIGLMLKNLNGTYNVVFKKHGEFLSYPAESIPSYELAFAITVHKSQGSEFNNIMVVLPEDESHPLLTREIIYTGITRAKARVFINGTTTSLETAVNNRVERESGIKIW